MRVRRKRHEEGQPRGCRGGPGPEIKAASTALSERIVVFLSFVSLSWLGPGLLDCVSCTPACARPKNVIVPDAELVTIAPLGLVVYCNRAMFNLTRQQQQFLCVVLLLFLVGWAVKTWRVAHPPALPAGGP